MQFAVINADGSLSALFNDPYLAEPPAGATPITPAIYAAWSASPRSRLVDGALVAPAPVAPQNPVTIPAAAYLGRFTAAETAAVHTAALAQPPTAASLQLFNFLLLVAANGSVRLTDPTVVAGHAFLVAQGLLTADRSAAILTP